MGMVVTQVPTHRTIRSDIHPRLRLVQRRLSDWIILPDCLVVSRAHDIVGRVERSLLQKSILTHVAVFRIRACPSTSASC
jgi:hypothetical protein